MLHLTTDKLHVHTQHNIWCPNRLHSTQTQTQRPISTCAHTIHILCGTHIIHTMHTKSIDSQTKHIPHTNTIHHIWKHITKTWYTTFTQVPCIYTDVFWFRSTKQGFSNFLDVKHPPGNWENGSYACGYICILCLLFMYLAFPSYAQHHIFLNRFLHGLQFRLPTICPIFQGLLIDTKLNHVSHKPKC